MDQLLALYMKQPCVPFFSFKKDERKQHQEKVRSAKMIATSFRKEGCCRAGTFICHAVTFSRYSVVGDLLFR